MNIKSEPLSDKEGAEADEYFPTLRRSTRVKKSILDFSLIKPRRKKKALSGDKEGVKDTENLSSQVKVEKSPLDIPLEREDDGGSPFLITLEPPGGTGLEDLEEMARSSESTLTAHSDAGSEGSVGSFATVSEEDPIFQEHSYCTNPRRTVRTHIKKEKKTMEAAPVPPKPTVDLSTLAIYRALMDHNYSAITPSALIEAVMLKHDYVCTFQALQDFSTDMEPYEPVSSYLNHPRIKTEPGTVVQTPQHDNMTPEDIFLPLNPKKGRKRKAQEDKLVRNPKYKSPTKAPKLLPKDDRSPTKSELLSTDLKPPAKTSLKKLIKTEGVLVKEPSKKRKKSTGVDKTTASLALKKDKETARKSLASKLKVELKLKRRKRRKNATGWPTKKPQAADKKPKKLSKPKKDVTKVKSERSSRDSSSNRSTEKDSKESKDDFIPSLAGVVLSIEEAVKRRRQSVAEKPLAENERSNRKSRSVSPKKAKSQTAVKTPLRGSEKNEVNEDKLTDDENGTDASVLGSEIDSQLHGRPRKTPSKGHKTPIKPSRRSQKPTTPQPKAEMGEKLLDSGSNAGSSEPASESKMGLRKKVKRQLSSLFKVKCTSKNDSPHPTAEKYVKSRKSVAVVTPKKGKPRNFDGAGSSNESASEGEKSKETPALKKGQKRLKLIRKKSNRTASKSPDSSKSKGKSKQLEMKTLRNLRSSLSPPTRRGETYGNFDSTESIQTFTTVIIKEEPMETEIPDDSQCTDWDHFQDAPEPTDNALNETSGNPQNVCDRIQSCQFCESRKSNADTKLQAFAPMKTQSGGDSRDLTCYEELDMSEESNGSNFPCTCSHKDPQAIAFLRTLNSSSQVVENPNVAAEEDRSSSHDRKSRLSPEENELDGYRNCQNLCGPSSLSNSENIPKRPEKLKDSATHLDANSKFAADFSPDESVDSNHSLSAIPEMVKSVSRPFGFKFSGYEEGASQSASEGQTRTEESEEFISSVGSIKIDHASSDVGDVTQQSISLTHGKSIPSGISEVGCATESSTEELKKLTASPDRAGSSLDSDCKGDYRSLSDLDGDSADKRESHMELVENDLTKSAPVEKPLKCETNRNTNEMEPRCAVGSVSKYTDRTAQSTCDVEALLKKRRDERRLARERRMKKRYARKKHELHQAKFFYQTSVIKPKLSKICDDGTDEAESNTADVADGPDDTVAQCPPVSDQSETNQTCDSDKDAVDKNPISSETYMADIRPVQAEDENMSVNSTEMPPKLLELHQAKLDDVQQHQDDLNKGSDMTDCSKAGRVEQRLIDPEQEHTCESTVEDTPKPWEAALTSHTVQEAPLEESASTESDIQEAEESDQNVLDSNSSSSTEDSEEKSDEKCGNPAQKTQNDCEELSKSDWEDRSASSHQNSVVESHTPGIGVITVPDEPQLTSVRKALRFKKISPRILRRRSVTVDPGKPKIVQPINLNGDEEETPRNGTNDHVESQQAESQESKQSTSSFATGNYQSADDNPMSPVGGHFPETRCSSENQSPSCRDQNKPRKSASPNSSGNSGRGDENLDKSEEDEFAVGDQDVPKTCNDAEDKTASTTLLNHSGGAKSIGEESNKHWEDQASSRGMFVDDTRNDAEATGPANTNPEILGTVDNLDNIDHLDAVIGVPEVEQEVLGSPVDSPANASILMESANLVNGFGNLPNQVISKSIETLSVSQHFPPREFDGSDSDFSIVDPYASDSDDPSPAVRSVKSANTSATSSVVSGVRVVKPAVRVDNTKVGAPITIEDRRKVVPSMIDVQGPALKTKNRIVKGFSFPASFPTKQPKPPPVDNDKGFSFPASLPTKQTKPPPVDNYKGFSLPASLPTKQPKPPPVDNDKGFSLPASLPTKQTKPPPVDNDKGFSFPVKPKHPHLDHEYCKNPLKEKPEKPDKNARRREHRQLVRAARERLRQDRWELYKLSKSVAIGETCVIGYDSDRMKTGADGLSSSFDPLRGAGTQTRVALPSSELANGSVDSSDSSLLDSDEEYQPWMDDVYQERRRRVRRQLIRQTRKAKKVAQNMLKQALRDPLESDRDPLEDVRVPNEQALRDPLESDRDPLEDVRVLNSQALRDPLESDRDPLEAVRLPSKHVLRDPLESDRDPLEDIQVPNINVMPSTSSVDFAPSKHTNDPPVDVSTTGSLHEYLRLKPVNPVPAPATDKSPVIPRQDQVADLSGIANNQRSQQEQKKRVFCFKVVGGKMTYQGEVQQANSPSHPPNGTPVLHKDKGNPRLYEMNFIEAEGKRYAITKVVAKPTPGSQEFGTPQIASVNSIQELPSTFRRILPKPLHPVETSPMTNHWEGVFKSLVEASSFAETPQDVQTPTQPPTLPATPPVELSRTPSPVEPLYDEKDLPIGQDNVDWKRIEYFPPPEVARLYHRVRRRLFRKTLVKTQRLFYRKEGRPPYSYLELAAMAIENEPFKSARFSTICDFAMKHFRFYSLPKVCLSKYWKHTFRTAVCEANYFRVDHVGWHAYYSFKSEFRLPTDPAMFENTEEVPTDSGSEGGDKPEPEPELPEAEPNPLVPICSYSDEEVEAARESLMEHVNEFLALGNDKALSTGDVVVTQEDLESINPTGPPEPITVSSLGPEPEPIGPETTPAVEDPTYDCTFCPASFPSCQDAVDHAFSHSEVTMKCPACEFTSPDDIQLMWHVNANH